MKSDTHPGRPYCYAKIARACKPRDRLTVSQWSDRHRILSSKDSGERGGFRSSRQPMFIEIMDALSVHSPVREVTLMFPAQFGKTLITTNWIGYTMEHAPGPMLGLMPSLESRDAWKLQKLNPLFAETECIRDLLGGIKSRDAAHRQDAIDFPGGILFLGGGNSPNSYAQRSVSRGFVDDLDRFPWEVGKEGSVLKLFRNRFECFPRYKFLKISTPTMKGASLIEMEYEKSDQRRYHVACPACGHAQHLRWANLKWDQTHKPPAWAEYECEECGHGIKEHFKQQLLKDGRWIPEHPERKLTRGYHANRLYTPHGLGKTWLLLAHDFLDSTDDQADLKVFVNTSLAETFEDQSTAIKPHDLAKRMEDVDMGVIPPGVLAITIAVDTQDTWLDVSVWGWTATGHRLIDWTQIQGDTTRTEVWDELEALLHAPRLNAWGNAITPSGVGIDSRGHRAKQVRDFVLRSSLRVRVYATQGSTSRLGRPIAQTASYPDKTARGKVVKGGYGIWNIGTEYIKDYLFSALASDAERAPDDRAIRFPSGLPTEYFNGMLSEVYNPETKRYDPKKGAAYKRNEPLDGFVIAYAIGNHREVMIGRHRNGKPDSAWWTRRAAVLEAGEAKQTPTNTSQSGMPTAAQDAPQPSRFNRRRVVNTGARP